jgi:uncharacterized DUF497 family protein
MRIIWGDNKNQENIRKHKISFEEAETVFYDPNGKLINDPYHSVVKINLLF